VASRPREGSKDFAWRAFAVPIEGIVERGRSTLGDRLRDPSRMFIRRRRLWLGSAHGAASENQATVAGIYGEAMSKSAKSTPSRDCRDHASRSKWAGRAADFPHTEPYAIPRNDTIECLTLVGPRQL
jgi:hypothetical protein